MNVRVDGDKLREIRRLKGIERRRLVDLSGVHYSTITRAEIDGKTMRAETAWRLAEALGVEVSDFIGEAVRNERPDLTKG